MTRTSAAYLGTNFCAQNVSTAAPRRAAAAEENAEDWRNESETKLYDVLFSATELLPSRKKPPPRKKKSKNFVNSRGGKDATAIMPTRLAAVIPRATVEPVVGSRRCLRPRTTTIYYRTQLLTACISWYYSSGHNDKKKKSATKIVYLFGASQKLATALHLTIGIYKF